MKHVSTTPWRYLVHKTDSRVTRWKKRAMAWMWHHGLIKSKDWRKEAREDIPPEDLDWENAIVQEPSMRERYRAGEDPPERPGEP